MNPSFPLYIPSKGRSDTLYTMRALQSMGVPFYVVVEHQDFDAYAAKLGAQTLLVLPQLYKDRYELCGPPTGKTGPGPARNFAWDHSIENGHTHHWVMDDNITMFYRLHENRKNRIADGSGFVVMERFMTRYANLGMSGPNYEMFAPRKQRLPAVVFNTRIYSCNLIRNDIPFRWRGIYNEDTILSLDMLKAGWCTAQFNAILQKKLRTQTIGGGNTAEFYSVEGTLPKSEMLRNVHPDVTRVVFKFGRWHHHVDYTPFGRNRLRRRRGSEGAAVRMSLKPRSE